MNEIEWKKSAKYVKMEVTMFKVIPAEETTDNKSTRTMIYCTQAVTTCKIEIVLEEGIERCLDSVFHQATFVNRSKSSVWWG